MSQPEGSTGPRFVDYGPMATVPGPLRCDATTVYCFIASADAKRLDGLCQRVFDESSAGAVQCRALGGQVLVVFSITRKITVPTPPWDRVGPVAELHAGVWVPMFLLRRGRMGGRGWGVFMPFVWVDNTLSLTVGREVYGYSKSIGRLGFPGDGKPDSQPSGSFVLDACEWAGLDDAHGPHPRRLLEVVLKAGHDATEEETFDDLPSLARDIADVLDVRSDLAAAAGLSPVDPFGALASVPQVFLRQLRSIEDGARASLSEVLLANATPDPSSFHAQRLRGSYDLTVGTLESHPLGRDLGLTSGPVRRAYRVDMDFTVETGTVLSSRR